jgi:hypothetical protein
MPLVQIKVELRVSDPTKILLLHMVELFLLRPDDSCAAFHYKEHYQQRRLQVSHVQSRTFWYNGILLLVATCSYYKLFEACQIHNKRFEEALFPIYLLLLVESTR